MIPADFQFESKKKSGCRLRKGGKKTRGGVGMRFSG